VLPFSRPPTEFLGEPTMAVIDEARRRLYDGTLASHGVTVLLNGDGGDTVLCTSPGPMPRHLADSLFDGKPVAALQSLARWKSGAHEQRSSVYWLLRALVAPSAAYLRSDRVRVERVPFPEWFRQDYARAMGLERRGRRRPGAPRMRQPGRQALWDDLWIEALGMTTFPRRAMTYSLRMPLMYRPLVEFMASIPWEQKLRPRCDRWLQRRALKGVLPELIRRRASKGGGTAPYVEGLRRSPGWMSYLTDAPLMAERGIVDAAAWRHAVRQASVGRTNSDRFFFAGVALETWLRQLEEHRARARERPDSLDAA
jgi:asparagine synthase (glutamine-hydrolysing)